MIKKIVLTIILVMAFAMAIIGWFFVGTENEPIAGFVCFCIALLMAYGVATAIE